MIIHIDAFTYIDDWDKTIDELNQSIECYLDNEDVLYEDYDEELEEELDENEYYNIITFDLSEPPSFAEMMSSLRTNPQTLFILWLEDEESGVHKYIMKDTYEHCIGFLDGIKYSGDQTGVYLTPFMDFTNIRLGLLAANTFLEVNEFFDYDVFGNDI